MPALKKYTRSITPAARENLLRQSLTAPSLTNLAHQAGVTAQSLYGWRRMARDGQIEVAADLREAIKRQLPVQAPVRRATYKSGTHLTPEQAQGVVLATVRRRKKTSLAKIASRYGVSTETVNNLRARARDGLIKLPKKDLAALQEQMSNRKGARPIATGKVTVTSASTPAKAAKKPKVTAHAKTAAPEVAPSTDVIVIRNGKHAIEIPASLDADRIAAVVGAAMAA